CKICGYPGHGVHFGVITCRACAAFFRRFVVMNLQYSCVKSEVRCSLDRIRRSSCRHCRFQKCLQMGMKADKVQWNRDTNAHYTEIDQHEKRELSWTSEPSISQSNQSFSETEVAGKISYYDDLDFSFQSQNSIQEEVYRIFSFKIENPHSLKPLFKFTEGLKRIREHQKTNDIKIEFEFSLESLALHWKKQAKNTAYLMTHSLNFQNLELSQKMKKFRKCWKSLYRLERILVSVEIFGDDCVTKKVRIQFENGIKLFYQGYSSSNPKSKCSFSLSRYFKKYANRLLNEVANPLIPLKLTLEEKSFLILTFLWTLGNFKLSMTYLNKSNDFLDEISDELHEYYRMHRVENCSPRALKMVKIVWAMKRIHEDDACGNF
ncbi:LOW QUALITY PROTEIN: Protein CBG04928, partial [Caenorhabditis briggsae]